TCRAAVSRPGWGGCSPQAWRARSDARAATAAGRRRSGMPAETYAAVARRRLAELRARSGTSYEENEVHEQNAVSGPADRITSFSSFSSYTNPPVEDPPRTIRFWPVDVRWASERGWLRVRDPFTGEWREIPARGAPRGWAGLASKSNRSERW